MKSFQDSVAKFVLSWALVMSLTAPASAQPPTLDGLLSSFSSIPGLSASFREEKRIALMALPIRSEGRIYYTPGRLLRTTSSPSESRALINAQELTIRSGDTREVIALRDNPVVAGFVGSIRHVLSGDRRALEAAYDLSFETSGESWVLTMRPRNADLRRFLREMVLEGEGVRLMRMRMREVSGDETTTEFFDVDVTQRYAPDEIRRLFRVD